MTNEVQVQLGKIERSHEWVPPKRGYGGVSRCRACGALRTGNEARVCRTEVDAEE